jgi:hypothetical protein
MNRMFKVGGLILEGPPMWTCENRSKYNRDKLHYPSDLTDEEWSHVAPLIPSGKRDGRKRKVDVREFVNGIMVCAEHGLSVALCSQRPSTQEHALRLFRFVEL